MYAGESTILCFQVDHAPLDPGELLLLSAHLPHCYLFKIKINKNSLTGVLLPGRCAFVGHVIL